MKNQKTLFGQNTEEAYKLLLKQLEDSKNVKTTTPKTQSIQAPANINPAEYITIPSSNILISKEQMFNNLNFENTHYKLAENNLFMPTPAIFMPYYSSVIQAKQRKINLQDGANNNLKENEVDELYQRLSKNCWVWLNAGFKNENNKEYLINYNVKNKSLIEKKQPLEACLKSDGYASLEFNKQGLATKISGDTKYQQDKNLYFAYPRNNAVAGFDANSVRVYLNCSWNPTYSFSSLGVFGCAAGVSKK